ncbi:hypothetical protein, partial [Mammaliicoccus lentus]|uniref:hypothetical protein n=1 Tax=Mammaliicoccus lentus TaxID=42858 RepID=UPI001BDC3B49
NYIEMMMDIALTGLFTISSSLENVTNLSYISCTLALCIESSPYLCVISLEVINLWFFRMY